MHGIGCADSYPFVTGDTFRAFADVVFDNTVEANMDNPEHAKLSSCVPHGYIRDLNRRFVAFALFVCLIHI